MAGKIDDVLTLLKGFSFDGDTGRTVSDLYAAVDGTGCTRDDPFAMPWWGEGDEKPSAANSFLDPDGRRIRVVWQSDDSGLSEVTDIIFDAASLAKPVREEGDACNSCSMEMLKEMSMGLGPEEEGEVGEAG